MRCVPVLCALVLTGCTPLLPTSALNPEGELAGLKEGVATVDEAQAALGPWLSVQESPARRGDVLAHWVFRQAEAEFLFVDLSFGPDGRLGSKAVTRRIFGYS